MILTPKLKLPRPEENDNHNLANQQALVDAIDANALPKSDKGIPLGLATLGADGKVIGSQLATPTNATTTTKGIVKLNDSTESTSVLEAATANAVRKVAEASATHLSDYLRHTGYAVATGSANAYIATLEPALSAYQEGVSLRLKINVSNTGASTVNVNGLGAKPIKKSNGNAVAAGNLKLGSVYTLAYDGTSFILQGEGGEYGNANAAQVLAPNTFGTESGVVTGTMPNRGVFNLGLGASVPPGYYSGGTAPNGKRWASGKTPSSVGGNRYQVSNLGFSPSVVRLINPSNQVRIGATFEGIGWIEYGTSNWYLAIVKPVGDSFEIWAHGGGSPGNIDWIAYE